MIIDGKKIANEIFVELRSRVQRLSFVPVFADVVVGDDPVSLQYVGVKERAAKTLGIEFLKSLLPASATSEEVISEIQRLSSVPNICGIIVQLPMPKTVDTHAILSSIPQKLDVDVVGEKASSAFYSGVSNLVPPTAGAVVQILESTGNFTDKKIVVVGKGLLVGKPVVKLLENLNLVPTIIDRQTQNPKDILLSADVIISGAGAPGFITGDVVKEGAIIIDAGTAESEGSIVGDVDTASVAPKASFLSPVPGGVGPVTVAKLYENVLRNAESA